MKRKTTILALVLAIVMSFGSLSVFATVGPATDVTKKAIKDAGVQCLPTIKNEVDVEKIAKDLSDQTAAGGYKLIDTATLKTKIDNKENILIIDTMPDTWWKNRHIPGAVCSVVGAMNSPKFEILPGEEKALLKTVQDKVGTKKVKYYWNSKSKKWVTKKPAKKYWKKCNKKNDKYKGKKTKTVTEVNKDATIIVYCGFTKCQRSHQGAMFLTKQGFTNVYRYAGGISAWVDANYPIEGDDVK
jgi:rhodanese-related sulfurtransferase